MLVAAKARMPTVCKSEVHESEAPVDVLPAGTVIDARYRITGLLGSGAVGHVYRAEEMTTRRSVALKMLRGDAAHHRELRDRLEREAFATAYAAHPNCVRIEELGTSGDGRLYLVMEHLEGISLAGLIGREQRLPIGRALRIAAHVLRGLSHAHGAGVLHRDLKPDNVFLARVNGDEDFAKILDFGLAKLVGEAGSGQPQLTAAGIVMGTPTYMPPEIITGQLDARSDLYSVSVMLFEMIAGRPPFFARSLQDVIKKHVKAPVPRFADVAPDVGVPAAVEAVIRRGLAKQPDARFATAAAYLGAVETLLSDPSVRAETNADTLMFIAPPTEAPPAPAQTPEPAAITVEPAVAPPPPALPPLPRARAAHAGEAGPMPAPGGLARLRASKRLIAAAIAGSLLLLGLILAVTSDSDEGAAMAGGNALIPTAPAGSQQAVIAAWDRAGLDPGGFGPVDGSRLGGDCTSGAIRGVEVTLCEFDDDTSAHKAKSRARKLIGSAKGKAIAHGSLLLAVADRMRADSAAETMAVIAAVFEKTPTHARNN